MQFFFFTFPRVEFKTMITGCGGSFYIIMLKVNLHPKEMLVFSSLLPLPLSLQDILYTCFNFIHGLTLLVVLAQARMMLVLYRQHQYGNSNTFHVCGHAQKVCQKGSARTQSLGRALGHIYACAKLKKKLGHVFKCFKSVCCRRKYFLIFSKTYTTRSEAFIW